MKASILFEVDKILRVEHFKDVYSVPKFRISKYLEEKNNEEMILTETIFFIYLPILQKIKFEGESGDYTTIKVIPLDCSLEIKTELYEYILSKEGYE